MKHARQHDLMVVGPWWKWGDPPLTEIGRTSAPALQKYDSSALIAQFLENPQRSLKFNGKDLVHGIEDQGEALDDRGRPLRFSNTTYTAESPELRKLFLDTHKRFYLVVCQISCDAPGLPKVPRDRICQAGFVIRRRTLEMPAEAAEEAGRALRDLRTARAQRTKLESAWSSLRGSAPKKVPLRLTSAKRRALAEQRASVRARVVAERERLAIIAKKFDLVPRLEGWFPSPTGLDRVGLWHSVEAEPEALDGETVFPLYPLHAPVDKPEHSGHFGSIYFGLLPTASREVDDTGATRFDSETLYEVSCFVRSHERPHGRGEACRCPGGLYWSSPTSPYRLAAPMDLVGTGQQPITVRLPSIEELAAQAAPIAGARFIKPPGSLMVQGNDKGDIDSTSRSTVGEICFIPIPLITIVAMFVFELFLPVIMLCFGLFWMLKLKFCIPPQVSAAVDFQMELDFDVGGFEAGIEASITSAFGKRDYNPDEPLDEQDESVTASALSEALLGDGGDGAGFSRIPLGNLAFDAREAGKSTSGVLSLSAGLEWEKEVKFQ